MYVEPVTVPGMPMSFEAPDIEPGQYTVTCVPARDRDGQIQNWTLKQLGNGDFQSLLRETLPDDRCTYYAPTVDAMSGVMVPHTPFTLSYELDDFRRILRPGNSKLHLGSRVPCDGTNIELLQGFLMSAGGCPLMVLNGMGGNGEDVCLAGHAGRNSILNGIVEAMVSFAVSRFAANPKHLILRSFFSLRYQVFPHDLNDPEHTSANQALYRNLRDKGFESALIDHDGKLCLSLNALIEMQAMRLGVGHIDAGLLNLPVNGSYAYTTHDDPGLRNPVRNLVYLRRYDEPS